MSVVNDILNEALEAWIAITGVQTGETFAGSFDGLLLRSATEDVAKSRAFDPSGVTTMMLFRPMVETYLKGIHFSALDLLAHPDLATTCLDPLRRLWALLNRPEVVVLVEDFHATLRDAARGYGVRDLGPLEQLLASPDEIGLVRRDALRSITTLEAHQFSQGESAATDLRLNAEVFQFWNVPSLLWALRGQSTPGITMALIRDPADALASFFCFGIRNGETITVLTDRAKGRHPAYQRMTRRPDRRMRERAERHRFPYELLDLRGGEEDDRLHAAASAGLVPLDAKGVPIARVADLAPDALVWTILVVDQLRAIYGVENRKLPRLSYSADRIVATPDLLATGERRAGSSALVAVERDGALLVPTLDASQVTTETTAEQWQRPTSGDNRWMTERYGAEVPAEMLAPLGAAEVTKLLAEVGSPSAIDPDEERSRRRGLYPSPRKTAEPPAPLTRTDLIAGLQGSIEVVEPSWFGTPEDLARDRLWVARTNQATAVQRLAENEYARTHEAVFAAYESMVRKNAPALIDAALRGELLLPTWKPRPDFCHGWEQSTENGLSEGTGQSFYSAFAGSHGGVILMPGRDILLNPLGNAGVVYDLDRVRTPCSIFALIAPTCAEALATLANVTVEELPFPLGHWRKLSPYHGNSILERIDPEDWILKNPWQQLRFCVGIAFCRSTYHARRKALGLPRKTWPTKGNRPSDAS